MTGNDTKAMDEVITEQEFGTEPTQVRETDHYQKEYVKGFVDQWDDLIDWDSRAKAESEFFIELLRKQGARRVLDVATGTGFHSVRLLEAGFDVVSVDGSGEMLAKAFDNARERNFVMKTVCADWRWLNQDVHGEFDAVICLGNSFTHLFNERDRRKALAEFYAVLKHDGILILDQRNYDVMVDHGYSSKHTFYYCGNDVKVQPDHIDEGLARMKYSFPDGSEYFLNMFPLRKNYTRRLMHEVGFQAISTYGDFQEVYEEEEPDFLVHVTEKAFQAHEPDEPTHVANYSSTVEHTREYYNSEDADRFYSLLWGTEDIHVGIHQNEDDAIADAASRAVEMMAERTKHLNEGSRVLDAGSGYGGAARYLARHKQCQVVGLNLSEVENIRAREINEQQGLGHLIDIMDGDFENIPYPPNAFDIVWSLDSLLHAGNRERAIEEISRVLKSGGEFLFTDPMMTDTCSNDALSPFLRRPELQSLGSPRGYKEIAARFGFAFEGFEQMPEHMIAHYKSVLNGLDANRETIVGEVHAEFIESQKILIKDWVEATEKGLLTWGLFSFRKR